MKATQPTPAATDLMPERIILLVVQCIADAMGTTSNFATLGKNEDDKQAAAKRYRKETEEKVLAMTGATSTADTVPLPTFGAVRDFFIERLEFCVAELKAARGDE